MKYRGLGAGKSRGNSHPYLGSPGDLCEPGQSGADPEFPSQAESVHGESQHPWEQQPRGKGQLKGFGATRAGLSGWFLAGCESRGHSWLLSGPEPFPAHPRGKGWKILKEWGCLDHCAHGAPQLIPGCHRQRIPSSE